jgi:hypothetical protein
VFSSGAHRVGSALHHGGKRLLAVVAVGALFGAVAPVADAGTARLKLQAPSVISASKSFRIVASGHGTGRSNFVAVFFTLRAECGGTYIAAQNQSHTFLLESLFVGRTFAVKVHPIRGGSPATGRICGYLYPRSGSPTWAYQKPEASASRRVRFT